MKGLRFDEVKLPEEVVDLEVYMKVDLGWAGRSGEGRGT